MRANKTITILASDRKDFRKQLINHFLEEEPGQGTGDLCSHYIYYVETLSSGNRVYLKRPAVLNKGFDFEVHVENMNFGTSRSSSMPSHKKITEDLQAKKQENNELFNEVYKLIDDIYDCKEVDIDIIKKLNFKTGHPIEAILFAIKWLFIEQDMTYWNWSGRNMLYSGLIEI
ncbi:MAG: hypothetical protein ABFC28_02475 [Rikenellaceae bacterium]